MKPAVFLDRDGTMHRGSRATSIGSSACVFFPYSVDAVRLLNRAGFAVVVVTNQAGVGRGLVDEAFVRRAHAVDRRAARRRRRADRRLLLLPAPSRRRTSSAIGSDCDCRKPRPGMMRARGRAISTSICARSFVVGDQLDATCRRARRSARKGMLVRTGYGRSSETPRRRPQRRADAHRRRPDRRGGVDPAAAT